MLRSPEGVPNWKRWLAPGIPLVCATVLAAYFALAAANAVHGYVAGYVWPAVLFYSALCVVVGLGTIVPKRTRRFGIGAAVGGVCMFPIFLGVFHVLDATGHVRWRNKARIHIGTDMPADLVVYITAGATTEQVDSVWNTVLSNPHPSGTGSWPLPGIQSLGKGLPVEGHESIAVTFRRSATDSERTAVRRRLAECNYVYKVLEDAVPSGVKTLE